MFHFQPKVFPLGIWCQNDVVSTSMRRNHVASTLVRRHLYFMCPLGCVGFASNTVYVSAFDEDAVYVRFYRYVSKKNSGCPKSGSEVIRNFHEHEFFPSHKC